MASLLQKLYLAVNNGNISSPFKAQDLKRWIARYNIVNDDNGKSYSDTYIESFLCSSTSGGSSTKTDKGLRKLGTDPEEYEFI